MSVWQPLNSSVIMVFYNNILTMTHGVDDYDDGAPYHNEDEENFLWFLFKVLYMYKKPILLLVMDFFSVQIKHFSFLFS